MCSCAGAMIVTRRDRDDDDRVPAFREVLKDTHVWRIVHDEVIDVDKVNVLSSLLMQVCASHKVLRVHNSCTLVIRC